MIIQSFKEKISSVFISVKLSCKRKMSQSRLSTCIPVPFDNKVLVNVIEKAKDWALMHGVGMRDKNHFTKDAIQVSKF